jgi:arylsulfate sulfotransferase
MTRLSGAVVSLLGLIFSLSAHAASTSITATTPGPTPFISNVTATYAGGTVASISYQISPMKGSFTRPFSASYSAQYLTSTGALQAGSVTIPVFGLYAGFTNTVAITFTFADQSRSVQTINITTASYTDPWRPA